MPRPSRPVSTPESFAPKTAPLRLCEGASLAQGWWAPVLKRAPPSGMLALLRLAPSRRPAVTQPTALPALPDDLSQVVARALAEDIGSGDLTGGLVDPTHRALAVL